MWTTDEGATSQVEYGPTTAYGSFSSLDSDLVLNHSIMLSSLDQVTLDHYRVHSRDQAGNESVSDDFTFNTIDTVAIQRVDCCYLAGTLTVRATSTDATAALTVCNGDNGELIGTLTNLGDGRYVGEFNQPFNIPLVDVVQQLWRYATRVATGGTCYLRSFSSSMAVFTIGG